MLPKIIAINGDSINTTCFVYTNPLGKRLANRFSFTNETSSTNLHLGHKIRAIRAVHELCKYLANCIHRPHLLPPPSDVISEK